MDMLEISFNNLDVQEDDVISQLPLFLILGFLTGIVIGRLPLPQKLETLHLHYCQKAETNYVATEAKQRLLVQKIPAAYLALHEIEMDTNRWWKQGSGWSLEMRRSSQL